MKSKEMFTNDLSEAREDTLAEAAFDPTDIPEVDFITELLDTKQYALLRRTLEEVPPQDIAELFTELDLKRMAQTFRLLPKELASEVFVELEGDLQRSLISVFSESELSAVLEEMYLDDTMDLIEEMPASVVKKIIRSSSGENRHEINRLLKYDRDSAGALMTPEYVRLKPDMAVRDALRHIREVAIDKETIYTCYVTDPYAHLIGIVTAKDLLISDKDQPISEIMEENVIYAYTTDGKEEVARMIDKYGFIALPVVDSEKRLVGIVTVDDAIDVLREETEEDFAKMAGIITSAEKSYIRTSVFEHLWARIPWLLLLMISSTISGAILTGFEAALPAVLILFVPMLMGTGGNSGGQSSVTVIRSLSLGEIEFRDILRVIWKETLVGVLAGVILGAVSYVKIIFLDGMLLGNSDVTPTVALVISLSLAATILISKLIGAILPMVAKKMHLDPAVMASPFITTAVDAVSLLLYFAVARYGFGL